MFKSNTRLLKKTAVIVLITTPAFANPIGQVNDLAEAEPLQQVSIEKTTHEKNSSAEAGAEELSKKTDPVAAQTEASTAVAEKKQPVFDIWEYQIENNTLLSPVDIEQIVYPYLGEDKTAADIEKLRQALENFYREKGFPTVLVNIPEQNVDEGMVRLSVTEGKIQTLKITGTKYHSPRRIRNQLTSVQKNRIPYIPLMQTQLSQLNRITPDRFVNPVLRPGRAQGTMEMELQVRDKLPLHGGIEINNQASGSDSDLRTSVSLSYSNLFQREHNLSLQYQTTPQDRDELKVYSLSYVMRQDLFNSMLAAYAVRTDTTSTALGDISVLGAGDINGLRWIIPKLLTDKFSVTYVAGFDYKDFAEGQQLGSDTSLSSIDYVNFSMAFNFSHRLERRQLGFGISPNFGLPGVYNDFVEFDQKRDFARPGYFYLKLDGSASQVLAKNFQLQASLDAQYTRDLLISNEQFSSGGSASVRGYYQSQFIADTGLRASLQLESPSISGVLPATARVQQWTWHIFADGAALFNNDNLTGEDQREGLLSTGFGTEFLAFKKLAASLDAALPLRSSGSATNRIEERKWRLHGKLSWSF
jgi:hemolysin activation/secretion protein